MERRARAPVTLDADLAAVALDDLAGDVETDTKARIALLFLITPTVELVEDIRQVFRGNADAEVLHAYEYVVGNGRDAHIYLIGARRIFDGVGQQVDEDLAEAIAISKQRRVERAFDEEAMSGSGTLEGFDGFTDQLIQ